MEFNRRKRTVSAMMEHKNYYKPNEDSSRIHGIVNGIFKKAFTINSSEKCCLPSPKSLFVESSWEIEELQKIKSELNETKSKLNNYYFAQWHQHTSQRNKAKDIEWRVRKDFNPEFVTQAWCKFHEIVTKYPLVPKENIFTNNHKFVSLHLCEAPGAFITCLNHWLKTNLPTVHWDWLAMTFNPYYEGNSNSKMISDDRFIMHTLKNWFFGKDNTGNLMTLENLDALIDKAMMKGKINLITADGSVNCLNNPSEQERIVVNLHFCETVAALHILQAGGNFLIKIFTIFEHQSICLMYFLSCVFEKIQFYKPVTSKEGNSETYVICLNFKGSEFISDYLPILRKQYGQDSTNAMFRKSDIPDSFVQQIINCARNFKNYQCEVIESNIATYNPDQHESVSNFEGKRIAKLIADKFITEFPLQRLHMDLQIIGNIRLKKNKNNHWVVQPAVESFNERQKKQVLEPVYRLLSYKEHLESMEKVSKVFIFKPPNLQIDIYMSVGKPYQYVQSSRFCPVQISEIYNLFFQVIEMEDKVELCLPREQETVEHGSEIAKFSKKPYKILYFQYTEKCDNNQAIMKIRQTLINLQTTEDLILTGYHFLTQFNVGLIYLLSCTFESVEFYTNELVGCTIIFRTFNNKESVLQKIEQVYDLAQIAIKENTAVLSIISVMELYGSELYDIAVKFNFWISKYCIKYITSVYGGKYQELLPKNEKTET